MRAHAMGLIGRYWPFITLFLCLLAALVMSCADPLVVQLYGDHARFNVEDVVEVEVTQLHPGGGRMAVHNLTASVLAVRIVDAEEEAVVIFRDQVLGGYDSETESNASYHDGQRILVRVKVLRGWLEAILEFISRFGPDFFDDLQGVVVEREFVGEVILNMEE